MREVDRVKAFCLASAPQAYIRVGKDPVGEYRGGGSNLAFISNVAEAFLHGASHEEDLYVKPQIGVLSHICSSLTNSCKAGTFDYEMVRDLGRMSRLLELSIKFFMREEAQEVLSGVQLIQKQIAGVVLKTNSAPSSVNAGSPTRGISRRCSSGFYGQPTAS